MRTKRLSLTLAAVLIAMGLASTASAVLPDPPFPWGTNPKTSAPVNSFCDAQQAIIDNSLISLLPPEFAGFIAYLAPETGDLNGTSFVVIDPTTFALNGNGMLDCSIELKLIEEVLKDTAFSVNGLTHANVMAAMNANDAQFAIDVGTYWALAPALLNGLAQVLHGHILIGDGDAVFSEPTPELPFFNRIDVNGSAAFIEALLFALYGAELTTTPADINNYVRMPQYFSKAGDADSDGASNECEYRIYNGASDPATYVANALNPAVHPTVEECNLLPVFSILSTFGGGWYEAGAPITIGVIVKDATGTVTYSWSKGGSPLAGETSSSLTLASPQESDSGTYRCTASDQSKAVVNADISITVVAAGSLPVTSLIGIAALLAAVVAAGAFAVRKARARA